MATNSGSDSDGNQEAVPEHPPPKKEVRYHHHNVPPRSFNVVPELGDVVTYPDAMKLSDDENDEDSELASKYLEFKISEEKRRCEKEASATAFATYAKLNGSNVTIRDLENKLLMMELMKKAGANAANPTEFAKGILHFVVPAAAHHVHMLAIHPFTALLTAAISVGVAGGAAIALFASWWKDFRR